MRKMTEKEKQKGMTMKNLTIRHIKEAEKLYLGYCKTCQDWTRDCTEPDAREYDCPVCEENTVYGSMEMLFELI